MWLFSSSAITLWSSMSKMPSCHCSWYRNRPRGRSRGRSRGRHRLRPPTTTSPSRNNFPTEEPWVDPRRRRQLQQHRTWRASGAAATEAATTEDGGVGFPLLEKTPPSSTVPPRPLPPPHPYTVRRMEDHHVGRHHRHRRFRCRLHNIVSTRSSPPSPRTATSSRRATF